MSVISYKEALRHLKAGLCAAYGAWDQQYISPPYIIFQVDLGLLYNNTGCEDYDMLLVLYSGVNPEKVAVNSMEVLELMHND